MIRWLSWLAIGTLTACATEPIELPSWDLPPASAEAVQPLSLPPLPEMTHQGDVALVDRAGLLMLFAYVEAAEANTDIAAENAAALEAQAAAYNSLLQAGQLMVEVARIREDMLAQERAEASQDRLFYRALIVLGAALAL